MYSQAKLSPVINALIKAFIFLSFYVLLVHPFSKANAAQSHFVRPQKSTGDAITADIGDKLTELKPYLYYPNSVERLYRQVGYRLLWIAPATTKSQTWNAMVMLDCVLQYGLAHSDYHPKELQYEKLQKLTEQFNKASGSQKERFDIMLTDAIINLINNLHYGKLNPDFPAAKIDTSSNALFQAPSILAAALQNFNLVPAIESTQPSSKQYRSLQNYMRLITGQYTGDCYEIPADTIQKVAINMERLRWADINTDVYVHINIPSYTLKLSQLYQDYEFKVIVGKPANPTPTLQSSINYFETAPEWKVPKRIFTKELLPKALKDATYLDNNHLAIYDASGNFVEPNASNLAMVASKPAGYYARQSSGCDNSLGLVVFRFPNSYDVYLHDTPEQHLFKQSQRAYSHGCIRVEQAEKLAGLLLSGDGDADYVADLHSAVSAYKSQKFNLKTAVPIKITYLTCEVKNGVLVTYDDIYQLDKSLSRALYNDYDRLL